MNYAVILVWRLHRYDLRLSKLTFGITPDFTVRLGHFKIVTQLIDCSF